MNRSRFCGRPWLLTVLWLMGSPAAEALAQQTLFNLPSAEITPAEQLFFQQQFNFNKFGRSSGVSNTTISYGLGLDFEIGMNVFALEVLPESGLAPHSVEPQFLFNAQKGIPLSESFKLGVGTQLGQTVPEFRRNMSAGAQNQPVMGA